MLGIRHFVPTAKLKVRSELQIRETLARETHSDRMRAESRFPSLMHPKLYLTLTSRRQLLQKTDRDQQRGGFVERVGELREQRKAKREKMWSTSTTKTTQKWGMSKRGKSKYISLIHICTWRSSCLYIHPVCTFISLHKRVLRTNHQLNFVKCHTQIFHGLNRCLQNENGKKNVVISAWKTDISARTCEDLRPTLNNFTSATKMYMIDRRVTL